MRWISQVCAFPSLFSGIFECNGDVSSTSELIDTKTDSLFATANQIRAYRVRSFSVLGCLT
jgi:hypothetical protein